MPRIFVDFNTMQQDERERVYINVAVPWNQDLVSVLKPGLHVILYDVDLEVEAVVEFDAHHQVWLGCPIWATQKDLLYP